VRRFAPISTTALRLRHRFSADGEEQRLQARRVGLSDSWWHLTVSAALGSATTRVSIGVLVGEGVDSR
jgi:hypothetical protein